MAGLVHRKLPVTVCDTAVRSVQVQSDFNGAALFKLAAHVQGTSNRHMMNDAPDGHLKQMVESCKQADTCSKSHTSQPAHPYSQCQQEYCTLFK
jgi:hypothetical protein